MRIEIFVSDDRIATALRCAASRYWCGLINFHDDSGWCGVVAGNGCADVELTDEDQYGVPPRHQLTQARIREGMALLTIAFADSFERILRGLPDGDDGDRLLQLATFGELVFG